MKKKVNVVDTDRLWSWEGLPISQTILDEFAAFDDFDKEVLEELANKKKDIFSSKAVMVSIAGKTHNIRETSSPILRILMVDKLCDRSSAKVIGLELARRESDKLLWDSL